jgi:hypothetical protein
MTGIEWLLVAGLTLLINVVIVAFVLAAATLSRKLKP